MGDRPIADSGLPIVEADQLEGDRTAAAVHGTVLAAGKSSRYGDANKLLAPLEGAPLVRHATATLVDSRVDGVTVILGHESERVRGALEGAPLSFDVNPAFESGQSTSVRAAVNAAREAGADAVLVALGDMPHVAPSTVDRLVEAYERGAGSVIVAGYDGQRGNPAVFDARHFDALQGVTGDVGGRNVLLEADDAVVLETDDPGVRRDVDRPDDLSS